MTLTLQTICGDRFPATSSNPTKCYRCECGFASCYKVMRLRTVQKPSPRSRFQCPAHQTECSKHSKYVKQFVEEVLKIDSSAVIIWDWCCVPGSTHMSIDASVVHGQRCTNFEIDGPQHFKDVKLPCPVHLCPPAHSSPAMLLITCIHHSAVQSIAMATATLHTMSQHQLLQAPPPWLRRACPRSSAAWAV